MDETQALFDTLRSSADQGVVTAIESVVRDGTDRRFAREHGLSEEKTINGFLHAARLGLFELTWNVLCPGCGGVLDATHTLSDTRRNGRSRLYGQPRACGESRHTTPTRSRSGNISGRFSGAPGSICPKQDLKSFSKKSPSRQSSSRPARRR
jgi:hypothetical protein